MPDLIRPDELRPCDVLLYHGDSAMAQLIQWFGGSEYSHAAIYDGSMVIEAIIDGVRRRPLAESVAGSAHVDVWRMEKEGQLIGTTAFPAEPVLGIAFRYAGEHGRYAYEELLLLALLCTTRRLPLPFLRWALDGAASILNDLIDEAREPMICSELVFRCFSEAGPGYAPRIRGVDLRARLETLHLPGRPKRTMSSADREVAGFLETYAKAKKLGSRDELIMAAVEADPNFITPRDLRKSPDFFMAGRLG